MFGFGGPSPQEIALQGQEMQLSRQLQSYLSTNYGEQQALWGNLTNIFSPIAAAGPNQTGFSAPELAALNTSAIDTTGGAYANAARAADTAMAAHGNAGVTSGINAQVGGAIAAQGAGQLSGEQNAITRANYEQGRQNWEHAMAGLGSIASAENPTPYMSGATSANDLAFGEAKTIQQQSQQGIGDLISGIAGLGMDFLPGGQFAGMLGFGGAGHASPSDYGPSPDQPGFPS